MLNDKSWKETQISRKQTKASPTASTSEEKENRWETCKWKKHVWVFDQEIEIEKEIGILILIKKFVMNR